MASYKLNFQNWQHWKCLIPRGPFKYYFKHAQLSKLSFLSMLIFKYDAETSKNNIFDYLTLKLTS